nr:hypothetical protein [Bradyrhizobium sp. NBAIM16]
MNRREFTQAMLAAGAAIPFGITRAAGQTRGGTLNTIIQPEPPLLVTAFNQQQPTLTLGGKIYESLLNMALTSSRCRAWRSPGRFRRTG